MTERAATASLVLMCGLCPALAAPVLTNRVRLAVAPPVAMPRSAASPAAAKPMAATPLPEVSGASEASTAAATPPVLTSGLCPAYTADPTEPVLTSGLRPAYTADPTPPVLTSGLCPAYAASATAPADCPDSPSPAGEAPRPAAPTMTGASPAAAVAFSRFDVLSPAMFSVMWLIREQAKAAELRGEPTDDLWDRYWATYQKFLRQDAVGGRRPKAGRPTSGRGSGRAQRPVRSTSPSNP